MAIGGRVKPVVVSISGLSLHLFFVSTFFFKNLVYFHGVSQRLVTIRGRLLLHQPRISEQGDSSPFLFFRCPSCPHCTVLIVLYC